MKTDLEIWQILKASLTKSPPGIEAQEWEQFAGKIDRLLSADNGTTFKIYTDAAARGNPGPAGLGVVIEDDKGMVVKEHCEFIGQQTNNAAEYLALIKGLELAAEIGAKKLDVYTDSELMSKQINGDYKVRNSALIELYMQARSLMNGFSAVKVSHVTRNFNHKADRLANMAIDAKK